MSTETQPTTTTPETGAPPMTMAEAAQEAALIDPPVKRFSQRLTCTLKDKELADYARKYADAETELENHDDETKELLAERKTTRAEIENRRKKLRQIVSVGREDRDVPCEEHVSIRQGRRWRVRLDTNETYEEGALTSEERQANLPIDVVDDRQLELPDGESEGESGEPPASTDVTDPMSLLDAATAGGDDEGES